MDTDKIALLQQSNAELQASLQEKEAIISKLQDSRKHFALQVIELQRELTSFGTFFTTFVLMIRKLQPVQSKFNDFAKKYEMDKVDDSKKEKKAQGEDVRGKMTVNEWLIKYGLSLPKMFTEVKGLASEIEPLLKDSLFMDYVDSFRGSLGVLYNHISPSLQAEEKDWFLSLMKDKPALASHSEEAETPVIDFKPIFPTNK